MINKYFLFLLCPFAPIFAMDTPGSASRELHVWVAVVDYDSLPCVISHRAHPARMKLPGGIVAPSKTVSQAAQEYLEQQTGIIISTESLPVIALATFDLQKREQIQHYYLLVDNHGLSVNLEEDPEDLHITNRSIYELINEKPWLPRDHSMPSVPVNSTLQKVAQHINDRCAKDSVREYLEYPNDPQSMCKLELRACQIKPEPKW